MRLNPAEALNESLDSHQKLGAFKGFLNTKDVSKEEKLELVSAFRLKNPNPELRVELDNIKDYVRNGSLFTVLNDLKEVEQERYPASDSQ